MKKPSAATLSSRRGSIVVVIMVVVVLGILGGVALAMSHQFGRRSHHEKLVHDAHGLARTAVEEASLLLNNGKRNAQISEALAHEDAVKIPLADIPGTPLQNLPPDQRPQVFVKATVVDPNAWKQSGADQMTSIRKTLLPVADEDTRKFWERVETEGLEDSDDCDDCFLQQWVEKVGLSKWKPRFDEYDPEETRSGTDADGNPVTEVKWRVKARIPELGAVHALFYSASIKDSGGRTVALDESSSDNHADLWFPQGVDPNQGNVDMASQGKPDLAVFQDRWEQAVTAVAQDAAQRVEACGANPSLAMAHLVGDLKLGNVIASGAEVKATADFMRDRQIGSSKTYLLEITAAMGYEGVNSRMKGKTAFRSYRILQKAEWEMAMERMTEKLCQDLQDLGGASLAPADFAQLYPPEDGVEGRSEPVLDKDGQPTPQEWDPKKFFADIVYAELPATVGARLYPYGVAQVDWNPDRAAGTDASAP